MLGSGPPRDGIIRTSPGQECSKDKGALPGARRISVYASRSWSRARRTPSKWFTSRRLILCLVAERVSLYPAKRRCARSSMDRASDYGSEGWGFESLRARSGPLGAIHRWGFCVYGQHPCGGAFPLPARRLPSCPACSVLPRSTPVRCHIPRRWAGWRSGLVDASDAEVIHVRETWAARAF